MNIQFKKGMLELCVFAILEEKQCYGYELVNDISKNIAISEGTIYPLLRRMKKEGLVTTVRNYKSYHINYFLESFIIN